MVAAPDVLPPVFRGVYAYAAFVTRLSVHTGEGLWVRADDRWSTLADWWFSSSRRGDPRDADIRRHVVQCSVEVERDVGKLRTWAPSPIDGPRTTFVVLYETLSALYVERREQIAVRFVAPGPLEGDRHPGFDVTYDVKSGALAVVERAADHLDKPLKLELTLPLPSRTEPRFAGNAFTSYGVTCAWELFALRALLIAMHARTQPAILELERDVSRPPWEHLLDHLAPRTQERKAASTGREWAYALLPLYDESGQLKLSALARREQGDAKSTKWSKQRFDLLYAEDASRTDRDIARGALATADRATEARVVLGTAQGHELLRLLADHPRVVVTSYTSAGRVDPSREQAADIVAGDLTMRLERAPNGIIAPRFFVGDREVAPAILRPLAPSVSPAASAFRGGMRGHVIVSVFVPPALRPWLATAESVGTGFSFPPEAIAKLAAATESLVASGIAELPREALGLEVPYAPSPALRVEWHREGAAIVDVLVSVHPSAPLVAPGAGPELLTFEHTGSRVFVERDMKQEIAVAIDARGKVPVPLLWGHLRGRTDALVDALELADWLDQNPLGLVIEVKIGRAPTVVPWTDATRDVKVRREGSWLVLDGALDVKGAKLTVADLLEAARLASRYVRAADGVFLELSREAIAKLKPVAIAASLAPPGTGDEEDDVVRVREAFGAVLADARSIFGSMKGVDLDEVTRRFSGRGPQVKVPKLEHGKLRPYQREGVAWMLHLATWAPGCILADDMGLGKTVQTAALLKARASYGPALIVAPASVTSNWIAELARFMPSLQVTWFNDDRETSPEDLGDGDVLVVSYGLLQRCAELFRRQRWSTVVIDEAQYVKNLSAQRTDAVRALSRDFLVALTGTPLENHLGELFSITDVAFPGLLGTEAVFRERLRKPIEGGRDAEALGVLARLIEPFLLRRTRAAVLQDLPAREEITEYVDLSIEEKKRYLALRKICEDQLTKRRKGETPAQLRVAILAALTRLRQLACDARLVDATFEGPSTKLSRAVDLAVGIAQEGNRTLVFSQFTQFLDKVKRALEEAGLRVAYLAGETATTDRRAIIDAFQAGEYDVFCVSLLAGGTGLNLTRASYVIHLDPWWNPAAEEQATSRAHRIGQTEPVTVYRLVSRGTIEEAVLDMHASKKDLARAVLDDKASVKTVSSSELLDLLRFGQ